MKDMFGSPGKISGLVLRIGQCSFAAASIGVMASAHGFFNSTAFWYIKARYILHFRLYHFFWVVCFMLFWGGVGSVLILVALVLFPMRNFNQCQLFLEFH